MLIMMEENNGISLAGDDTWPNQYTKSIPQHFLGAIHSVRTHLMTNFSTPLDEPLPFPQLRTYLMVP